MAALEKRIQHLESRASRIPSERCQGCGEAALYLALSEEHPTLGMIGVHNEVWCCSRCGQEEHRQVNA
jgi:transposase